jgi:putative membrane protein
MLRSIIRFGFNVGIVLGCTYLFPFVHVQDVRSAILFVAVISLLNIFVKPFLTVITIPLTLFTFGFFLLIINGIMVRMADYFIDGFEIEEFWHAFLFGLILSLSNMLFEKIYPQENQRY